MEDRAFISLRIARWTPEPVFAINGYPEEDDPRSVRATLEVYLAVLRTHAKYVARILKTNLPETIETSMLVGPFLVDEIKLEPGRLERIQNTALEDIPTALEDGTQ